MHAVRITRTALAAALFTAISSGVLAADGTFSGTAQGIASPVTVTVTVQNGKVTEVKADTSGETPGYGRDIAGKMSERILVKGSSGVDGVTGATVTSNAVRAAAEAALRAAGLSQAQSAKLTPGTFEGTARGAKSDVHMTIEVSPEGRIRIADVKAGDTEYVSETAIREVSRRIEAEQSLAVDAVTGATLTSRAVTEAAGRAIAAAGGNPADWRVRAPASAPVEAAPEEADIVVVGGGAAGMLAALAAKTDDALSGKANNLRVVLLETKGYLGGDLAICGGYIASYSGSFLNRAAGHDIDGRTVAAASKAMRTPEAAAMLNDGLAERVVDATGFVMERLVAQGVRIAPEDATLGAVRTPYFEDGVMHYAVARTTHAVTGYRSMDQGYDDTTGSPWVASGIAKLVMDAGVDVRLETTADDVILENGAAAGVVASDGKTRRTIRAKAVILATGYSGLDPESVDMFYPNLRGVTRTGGAGVTSFAPKWVIRQGGEAALNPASSTMLGYDSVIGLDGPEAMIYRDLQIPWVDRHGRRFMSEAGHPTISRLTAESKGKLPAIEVIPGNGHSVAEVMKLDGMAAFMIIDSESPAAGMLERLKASNLAWSADTLEELAQKAGIDDPAAFAETIRRYNADAAAGKDSVFGTPAANMTPVVKAPFHAVRVTAVNTIANVTAWADDDMTILSGPKAKGAKRYEHLYGAGGAIGNAITNAGLGAHNATSLASGALAGIAARRDVMNR
ncbi:FMN-binding protein [Sutterella sp.]|uniref:FMN-binding protein n=1 Tax=Sutterella sp. TaxID=1981025 RepID=UPI0026DF5D43|nr:FMN-binding protein [Sutterella sp.]MDO5532617.1 FMN-binding protein [Sutterella sp.]